MRVPRAEEAAVADVVVDLSACSALAEVDSFAVPAGEYPYWRNSALSEQL